MWLVAFLVVSWALRFDARVIVADIALLVLVAIVTIILLVQESLGRALLGTIVILAVVCFLTILGYTVYRLLNAPNSSQSSPTDPIKDGCLKGNLIDCQTYAAHIAVKCNQFDMACKLLAQCWDDKVRAMQVVNFACSDKGNKDACALQRQAMRLQLLMDCDTKTLKDY